MKTYEAWNGFVPGEWSEGVNVRDFIQKNYTPYTGNGDFHLPLSEASQRISHPFPSGSDITLCFVLL